VTRYDLDAMPISRRRLIASAPGRLARSVSRHSGAVGPIPASQAENHRCPDPL